MTGTLASDSSPVRASLQDPEGFFESTPLARWPVFGSRNVQNRGTLHPPDSLADEARTSVRLSVRFRATGERGGSGRGGTQEEDKEFF